jgi:hypothetical protein
VDVDVATVVQCELALLLPEVRRDPQRMRALLHPDFVEYGSSGRVWDRGTIGSVSADPEQITAADLIARRIGPDAVLLTYRSTRAGRNALRSSTWIRDETGTWLLLFHQGTPVPDP